MMLLRRHYNVQENKKVEEAKVEAKPTHKKEAKSTKKTNQ